MCEYACKNALRENSDIRPCSVYSVLGLLQLHFLPWAARYNTWLLIKLTLAESFLFFSFSFYISCFLLHGLLWGTSPDIFYGPVTLLLSAADLLPDAV